VAPCSCNSILQLNFVTFNNTVTLFKFRYSDKFYSMLIPGGGLGVFSTVSRLALGPTQPSIQSVRETCSPGVKWPGREADHSPPFSAEVKNMWCHTSTPSTS
jgi:hypothetical protein